MFSSEFVPNDVFGVRDRLASVAQNLSTTRTPSSLGISLIFAAIAALSSPIVRDCSDTHCPSDTPTVKNLGGGGGSNLVNEVPTRRHTSC